VETTGEIIVALLAAAGLGAVVGLERQEQHTDGGDPVAGARTFALYGLWGAASAFFADRYGGAAFAVGAAAFAALILIAYVLESRRRDDFGTTTEAAALATFAVGVLAWNELYVPAVAITVGLTALLRAKEWFHRLTDRYSDDDVRAVLQFAVITAVVLPLVPDEDVGPFEAINPREIWLMVIFVSAIGLAGYLALRVVGSRGLGVTGLLGGLVSSTAVTLGFARMSQRDAGLHTALVSGILAASGLMYARVLVEAFVIAPDLGRRLVPLMVGLFLAVEGAAVWWWTRPVTGDQEADVEVRNPLTLSIALQFGALYGVIVFFSELLSDRVSDASLSIVGAVSGINDVDAITLSTANLVKDGLAVDVGARVVVAAVAVNTLVKGGLAVALGTRRLGLGVGIVLGLAGAVAGAGWFFV
jgi:uncharacterized membrane protein (DUF4010 family)